jgi:hypothetical protein
MRAVAGLAILGLAISAAAQESTPVARFGVTVVVPFGLSGVIYHIKKDSERLPNFDKLKPLGTIYTASLNVPSRDFREGFPGITKRFEWFAIDYTGRFWIEKPGPYRFLLTSDDGSRLFIDGRQVVDNDGIHNPQDREGSIELAAGIHRIRVMYFQGPRTEVALVLKVAAPGEELRVFSTDEFKPPAGLESWPEP